MPVNEGEKQANGLTIGILPANNNDDTSVFVDIAIITGMGSARNNINVLTSVDGLGSGTVFEAAMALKAKKQIILLGADEVSRDFFQKLGHENVSFVNTPQEALEQVKKILN